MKDFMFIFSRTSDSKDLSPEEMQSNMQEWFAWVDKLKAAGAYVSGEALLPGGKTVKGKGLVTDGPFADSKEAVGGYFIVKAKSIEDAADMAKGCPDMPIGGIVEVREVMVFE